MLEEDHKNSLFMYLTEASRYAVEEFVGQLPPYTKFSNFVYRMSQLGLTATENEHIRKGLSDDDAHDKHGQQCAQRYGGQQGKKPLFNWFGFIPDQAKVFFHALPPSCMNPSSDAGANSIIPSSSSVCPSIPQASSMARIIFS